MTRLLLIVLALLFCAAQPAEAQKRSSATVRKERQQANKRVALTREQIEENKRQTRARLNDLNLLQAEVEAKTIEIRTLKGKLRKLDTDVQTVTDSIAMIAADVDRLKKSAAESARQARRMRQSMTSAAMIFSSDNFRQMMKRANYLKQLDKSRVSKTKALKSSLTLLDEKKERLAQLREQQTATLASLEREQQALQAKEEQAETLVAQLRKDGKALQAELAERESKARSLEQELQRAIDEEQRAAALAEQKRLEAERLKAEQERLLAEQKRLEEEKKRAEQLQQQQQQQSGKKPKDNKKKDDKKKDNKKKDNAAKPAPQPAKQEQKPVESQPAKTQKPIDPAKLSASFAAAKGKLPAPVSGQYSIVAKFGRSNHASLSRVEVENAGIDIQAPSGASARAIFQGTVSSIFHLDGYHNIVMVRHGEYLTVFANLVDLSVKKGDTVTAGQVLGKIYTDPDDGNRSILHFEIRKEREKLNPQDWLAK